MVGWFNVPQHDNGYKDAAAKAELLALVAKDGQYNASVVRRVFIYNNHGVHSILIFGISKRSILQANFI